MFWEEKINLKLYFYSVFAEYAFHGNIYKCEYTYYMTLINFIVIFQRIVWFKNLLCLDTDRFW